MVHRIPLVAAAIAAAVFGAVAVVTPPVHAIGAPATTGHPADATARGGYRIRTSGYNDCHTADFAMTDGKVPEKDWLTGDALGWQGPWGTTYAPNMRTYFQTIDEESWVSVGKTRESVVDPTQAWWVAERDGDVLGFANAGSNTLPHPEGRTSHAELRRLYIAKRAQGAGLGTRLLEASLAWMETHTDGPLFWLERQLQVDLGHDAEGPFASDHEPVDLVPR